MENLLNGSFFQKMLNKKIEEGCIVVVNQDVKVIID